MGRPRSQPEQATQTTPEGQIAVALLSGASVGAVAPALLLAMPASVLALPALAARIAEDVARMILSLPLDVPDALPNAGILREAALNAVVYRAAFALAATRRISGAVIAAEPEKRTEALRTALARERQHLAAHREVTRRRMSAAKTTEGMMELHGPILIWRHGQTRTPDEPRPHHKAADGKAFDLRRGIPVSTGSLPGVEMWCSCAWGPPVAGAAVLI